jgi:hypothetical protein
VYVARADDFADFASLPSSSSSDEDDADDGEAEDGEAGERKEQKQEEEEDEETRSREELIEEMKDQFFRFVDLPSGKKVMVFKYKDRFYASNAVRRTRMSVACRECSSPTCSLITPHLLRTLRSETVVPAPRGRAILGRRGRDQGRRHGHRVGSLHHVPAAQLGLQPRRRLV